MEDNNLNQQKPLRRSSNKIKDIYDAYVKNDKSKNIPISDSDSETQSNAEINTETNQVAPTLDDAAFIEMQTKIEELAKSLSEYEAKTENLQKENSELKELTLRKTAELENFRRRSIKEKSDLVDYANEKLLSSLVEILDDLTAANNAASKTEDVNKLKEGLELILNKSIKLFEDAGVSQMKLDENTEFDVNFHEALMMAPSDKPEGTVIQVLQNGYLLKEKILRHAKVITSSGVANN